MAQINIAGTLHNTEEIQGDALNSHVVAHADEILDSTQEKKQSEVNADVDTALADRYTKSETYSKSQLDNLITTPAVQYVTVATYSALPASGEADTIYRVASWDGTAVDAGKYSEYAWNGTAYQLLAVRSGSPDGVYDISANNLTEGQPTQYADLAAALGTNGANVPVGVRAGGMSVRFINSDTHKYEQWRLMAASWSTNVADWQGVDETPTEGSQNLVTSGGVYGKISQLERKQRLAISSSSYYDENNQLHIGSIHFLESSASYIYFNLTFDIPTLESSNPSGFWLLIMLENNTLSFLRNSDYTYTEGDIILLEFRGLNIVGGALQEFIVQGIENKIDSVENQIITINNSIKTIIPKFEQGAINSVGKLGGSWYNNYWRSVNLFKINNTLRVEKSFTIINNLSKTIEINLFRYGINYNYLTNNYVTITSGNSHTITLTPNSEVKYFYLVVRDLNNSVLENPTGKIIIQHTNCIEGYSYAPYSETNNGYQKLIIPVNVTNAYCCDEENIALQDQSTILVDYGLIALPSTYSPEGKPTRLVIYCHGAGVNYNSDISEFPSSDLLPEYWLSEGLAIMDIEGNPYNNEEEHGYIPAAREAYISAYKWVIRHYNIAKDGVYLGGRSMGGGMCFELLQSTIPIIAACPVVPVCNELWWWEYMNAARRQFCAQKMGFSGTEPTWTNNSPMSNEEWQYLQDNFNKLVKYAPFWRGIECLPNKETLFSLGNIGKTTDSEIENTLFNALHFKVKAPVKMFASKDDSTVYYKRNCKLMNQMLLNAGQICEMRYFPSGGHHFELTSAYLLASYTNSFGVTLTNVPIVYIEMLQFWRRYDLNY